MISVACMVQMIVSSNHANPWILIFKQTVKRRASWDLLLSFFFLMLFQKALFYYASSSLIINKTKSHQGFYVHGNIQSKSFGSYSDHLNTGKKCKECLLIGKNPVSGDLFFATNTFTATGRRIVLLNKLFWVLCKEVQRCRLDTWLHLN